MCSGTGETERCDAAQLANWRCGWRRRRCEERCCEWHLGKNKFWWQLLSWWGSQTHSAQLFSQGPIGYRWDIASSETGSAWLHYYQLGWIGLHDFGLCFYCYRLFLFLADSQTQLMQLLPFFAKNIPIFHALLTWFFLVGYRETWSQEQCWFSGQYNGSKSLCKTRIRPITFTRFAFSPIGSLSSRASTVCTWCVRVHACVCVLDWHLLHDYVRIYLP